MASSVTLAAALRVPTQVLPSKVSNANVNAIRAAGHDLQVRNKIERGELKKGRTTRRDAIFCLSATLLLATLTGGGSAAEARTVMKPEIRRKIWEKLDRIREKAGVAKEKMDSKLPEEEEKPAEETGPDLSEQTETKNQINDSPQDV